MFKAYLNVKNEEEENVQPLKIIKKGIFIVTMKTAIEMLETIIKFEGEKKIITPQGVILIGNLGSRFPVNHENSQEILSGIPTYYISIIFVV